MLPAQLGYRYKTPMQKIVVALSSLFYLIPAYVFWATPGIFNELGALIFVLVSFFSALADGSLLEEPFFAPGVMAPYAGMVDRWIATLGGGFGFYMWLRQPVPSLPRFLLQAVFAVGSVLPLQLARKTPFNQPWRWALLQIVWHLSSALIVTRLAPHPTNAEGGGVRAF